MSSIMTNSAAMTALQTLRNINSKMETTQDRISTGYRVATAQDNAAYWSIATTMRSDNAALSTVEDALGLGAATVDVAYTAMESTKDVLDEIKTKLVAAKQPGIDKGKIQEEISQLQNQLTSISSSAVFSGNNWLSVDSSDADYTATPQIVSSFSRDVSGSITVGTVDVDITGIALFDASSTAGGLLEGTAAEATSAAAFAWTAGTFAAGDSITFAIDVDGESQNIAVTFDSATVTIDDVVAGLNEQLVGASASKDSSDNLVLTSDTLGANSSIELTGITVTQADATTAATIGFTTIAAATGSSEGGGVLGIDISDATQGELDSYIRQVDAMTENVTTAAADLGAVKSRIDMQKDFVGKLMDAIDRGVGQLVDADMNEESTRLQALQVQQQLGIQALSIANSNSQNILSLFR